MVKRHREQDTKREPSLDAKSTKRIERLQRDAKQIREWLVAHAEERQGSKGTIRKSNRTDNDSAKMATSKGVMQGYCGVAAVDAKHQIIVEAQAHGTGSEQWLRVPVVKAMMPFLMTGEKRSLISADAGYHSEANLAALDAMKVDALIADNGRRGRDERFVEQHKHKAKPDPLHDKRKPQPDSLFRPHDFTHDPIANRCICPAGQSLYSNGTNCTPNGRTHRKFQGSPANCGPCTLRAKCLRHPDKTKTRQVAIFAKRQASPLAHTQRMRERIDSEEGKRLYGGRFATVEPVFGNIRHNKRLNRFTLRGQKKVDVQWKLFCLVHNIEKLANHGYAMPPATIKSRNLNA